jgi:hypothetical protein
MLGGTSRLRGYRLPCWLRDIEENTGVVGGRTRHYINTLATQLGNLHR